MQVEMKFTFTSMEHAIAFMEGRGASAARDPETAKDAATPKPVEAKKAAATQPTAPAAAAPTTKPAKDSAASAAPVTYEKSGIPEKIATAVSPLIGKRAEVIALLAKFGAKKGGELKPADFPAFIEEINTFLPDLT
jgi:uncharacterized membrane protein